MQKAGAVSLVVSALLLGTAVISGCSSVAAVQQDKGTAISVQVAQATKGWITQGPVYIGTVQPSQEVQVLPKIPGKVAAVNVSVGARVKTGDTLFKLDDTDLRDAVSQAQAAVAAANAGVQTAITQQQSAANQASGSSVQAKGGVIQAQNNVNLANNAVVQAQNSVTTAKQALDDATTNKTRYEQLYAQYVVPKATLEQYETAYVAAQANYNNAQKGLQTAQAGLATAQQALANASAGYDTAQNQVNVSQSTAGVDASRKAVDSAQVGLQAAQNRLADATVTSPIDGIVGVKNLEVGDMVNPDFPPPQPVLVVANLDLVKVLVYIPANGINQVQVGASVMVKSVALNTYFQGKIKTISPLDNQGKGYPVEVEIPNQSLQLKKGMVTEVGLLGPDAKQGILVPTAAIQHDSNGKAYVFVADQNTARRKEITLGQQEGSQTLVSGGINEGDSIIINQLNLLSDNAKITVESNNPSKP